MEDVPRMMTIQQAIEKMIALGLPEYNELTVITWIEKYKLGHKIAGKWVIREDRFRAFLLGELNNEKDKEKTCPGDSQSKSENEP